MQINPVCESHCEEYLTAFCQIKCHCNENVQKLFELMYRCMYMMCDVSCSDNMVDFYKENDE